MIVIVPAGQNDGLFLSSTQESNFVYKTGPQKTQASWICTLWKSEQFSVSIELLIDFLSWNVYTHEDHKAERSHF